MAEIRHLPVPVGRAARRSWRARARSPLPATVAAATGGFMLGVAAFMLIRVLRRPSAARGLTRRRSRLDARRRGRRRAGHALVPRRRPPAQALNAAARQPLPRQDVECHVVPAGPFRMPGGGRDGVMRRRDGVLTRLLHVDDEPVRGAGLAGRRARSASGPRGRRRDGPRWRSSGCASRSASTRTWRPSTAASGATRSWARWCGASRGCARGGGPSRSRRWHGRSASSSSTARARCRSSGG